MADPVEKSRLRAVARETLRLLDPTAAESASAAIAMHLLASPAFAAIGRAGRVLVFAPMPHAPEVDLSQLSRRVIAAGVHVHLPRVDWNTRTLTPVRVLDWDRDVSLDSRGVPTVVDPAASTADPANLDIILVPGLAFDRQGFRLGRGGGFYDRLLAQPGLRAATFGVCFDRQVLPRVPREPHDLPVRWLATESGCWRAGESVADNEA